MPPLRRLIEELARGVVGKPVMMSIREHRYPYLRKVGDWNRFNANTGGTMVEKCCHFWDLMRLVLNSDPVRVYASASIDVNHLDEEYGGRKPDIFDNGFAILDFANGTRGMLDLCMFGEGSHWQEMVSVTGSAGRIDACVPKPGRFSADKKDRAAQIEISERASGKVTVHEVDVDEAVLKAGDHHGATYFQHRKFLDLLRSGAGAARGNASGRALVGDGWRSLRKIGANREVGRAGSPIVGSEMSRPALHFHPAVALVRNRTAIGF